MKDYLDPAMNGVTLASFAAAVVQFDWSYEFSDDADVRIRGGKQLSEIIEMKKALGPAYSKVCRDIWNAEVDRVMRESAREEHYWYEGATGPGAMAGYIAEKKRMESGEERGGEVALTREQINKEMQEYARIRGEMQDKVGKGVVSACDDIYRRVFEEGWYGRTIHDVIYERQLPDADKGPDAVDDEQKEIEDIRQSFYRGQEQGKDQQQGYVQGQGEGI